MFERVQLIKRVRCSSLRMWMCAGAEFSAANGAVLPFGCMEAAVKAAGKTAEFGKLLERMESCDVPKMQALCDEMASLLKACPPDAGTLVQLRKELAGVTLAIARSSANVEDLEGLSGAGLYESIPNLEVRVFFVFLRQLVHNAAGA